MITIKGIKKYYGLEMVLNISQYINFAPNKIHGIIGNNGSGKTTLLRIISGLDNDFSGEIERESPIDLRQITYVKQKPYMMKRTVKENIMYPLKVRGVISEEREQIVGELIKEFKLETLENKDATRLSSGETQRVAIARALSFDPRLLILDEPLSNLDPEYVELIENAIHNRVKSLGTTILIVTHSLSQAKRLCDDIYFMYDGDILEYGQCDMVLNSPIRKETKRFLSYA